MSEAAVAEPAAVEEQVLPFCVAALARRICDVAVDPNRSLPQLHRVKAIADFGSEEQADPFEQPGGGRYIVDFLVVVAKRKVQLELGQGQPGERLADVAHLGANG